MTKSNNFRFFHLSMTTIIILQVWTLFLNPTKIVVLSFPLNSLFPNNTNTTTKNLNGTSQVFGLNDTTKSIIGQQDTVGKMMMGNNVQHALPPSLPNNVSLLTIRPDVNHALTIDHQNFVINLGQSLSEGITNAIVRPLTFVTNLIGSAAGSLPGLFAANGAALGTAIATPIQMGTLAANAAISGITGTVVSIPISLASGGAAQLVGLVGTGRQLWHSTLGSDPQTSEFWHNGDLWLQPLAVVTGANSILAGVSLNMLSQGVKNLGLGIENFGVSLTNTGHSVKRLGSILIGWANGRPIYAPVVNDTETNEINVDLSEMIQPIEVFANITLDKSELDKLLNGMNLTEANNNGNGNDQQKNPAMTNKKMIPIKDLMESSSNNNNNNDRQSQDINLVVDENGISTKTSATTTIATIETVSETITTSIPIVPPNQKETSKKHSTLTEMDSINSDKTP